LHLAKLPPEAFADGKQDRYLRALENDCKTSGSSHPKEINALYRQKGLEERAAKFRADCEKSFQYDIGYYFKMVDKELARAPIGR